MHWTKRNVVGIKKPKKQIRTKPFAKREFKIAKQKQPV